MENINQANIQNSDNRKYLKIFFGLVCFMLIFPIIIFNTSSIGEELYIFSLLAYVPVVILLLATFSVLIYLLFDKTTSSKLKKFFYTAFAQLGLLVLLVFIPTFLVEAEVGFWTQETGSALLWILIPAIFYFYISIPVAFFGTMAILKLCKDYLFKINILKLIIIFGLLIYSGVVLIWYIFILGFGSVPINPDADLRVIVPGSVIYSNEACECKGYTREEVYFPATRGGGAENRGVCYGKLVCDEIKFNEIIEDSIRQQNSNITQVKEGAQAESGSWELYSSEVIPAVVENHRLFVELKMHIVSKLFITPQANYIVITSGEPSITKIFKQESSREEFKELAELPFSGYESFFVSPNEGYIMGMNFFGENFFYKTTDGGNNWNEAGTLPELPTQVYFLNPKVGFITSNSGGNIYKTEDGGSSWRIVYQNYDNLIFQSPYFFSEKEGYIVGSWHDSLRVLHTEDRGENWSYKETYYNNMSIRKSFFLTPETGFILDANGLVFRTSDGGENFADYPSIRESEYRSGFDLIDFKDIDNGIVVLNNGAYYRTSDSGRTWKEFKPNWDDAEKTLIAFTRDKDYIYGLDNAGRIYLLKKYD